MTFGLLCMGLIAVLFGLVMAFYGYKLFLLLLPIWGFFAGFVLGAQTIQVIFDVGFLTAVTSWVVGFVAGALFAVLAYLFYIFAVGVISFSLGYGLAVSILQWIGLDWGFLVWLIALAVGAVAVVVVLRFNVAKYVIILATSIGGTGALIYTFLALFSSMGPVELMLDPVRSAISDSFWWLIFFLAVAIAGIVAQIRDTSGFEAEAYNRLEGSTEAA